jgi:uncharacterized surface anchored protein
MNEPLPEADFEIRDSFGKVRGGKTDKFGKFKISDVSPGTYAFKAAKDGFQSVAGKVTVAKRFTTDASVRLTMPLGV